MAGPAAEAKAALTRRQLLAKASLAAAVLMLSGCQSAQKLEVTQSGAPKFERFRAEYRFDNADQLLGRSFADTSGDVGASDIKTVSAVTSRSDARLNIECPHPRGDTSLALLTLTLSERRGPASTLPRDVRQLSIERSHVELLIGDLANQGFFDKSSDVAGGTQLEVQIDRGKIDRAWQHDARLLDLARQTLTDGNSDAS
jgi:hypothetical protein